MGIDGGGGRLWLALAVEEPRVCLWVGWGDKVFGLFWQRDKTWVKVGK